MPLGVAVDGANRPDAQLLEPTLRTLIVERPAVSAQQPQHLCLDAGYDHDDVRRTLAQWGYTAHITTRQEAHAAKAGEEAAETAERQEIPGYRARRWVVERSHSWMNRFRRLLIRWEKKKANYLALVHFACAWIAFSAAGLFG